MGNTVIPHAIVTVTLTKLHSIGKNSLRHFSDHNPIIGKIHIDLFVSFWELDLVDDVLV